MTNAQRFAALEATQGLHTDRFGRLEIMLQHLVDLQSPSGDAADGAGISPLSHAKAVVAPSFPPFDYLPAFSGSDPLSWLLECVRLFQLYEIVEKDWVDEAWGALADDASVWFDEWSEGRDYLGWNEFFEAVLCRFDNPTLSRAPSSSSLLATSEFVPVFISTDTGGSEVIEQQLEVVRQVFDKSPHQTWMDEGTQQSVEFVLPTQVFFSRNFAGGEAANPKESHTILLVVPYSQTISHTKASSLVEGKITHSGIAVPHVLAQNFSSSLLGFCFGFKGGSDYLPGVDNVSPPIIQGYYSPSLCCAHEVFDKSLVTITRIEEHVCSLITSILSSIQPGIQLDSILSSIQLGIQLDFQFAWKFLSGLKSIDDIFVLRRGFNYFTHLCRPPEFEGYYGFMVSGDLVLSEDNCGLPLCGCFVMLYKGRWKVTKLKEPYKEVVFTHQMLDRCPCSWFAFGLISFKCYLKHSLGCHDVGNCFYFKESYRDSGFTCKLLPPLGFWFCFRHIEWEVFQIQLSFGKLATNKRLAGELEISKYEGSMAENGVFPKVQKNGCIGGCYVFKHHGNGNFFDPQSLARISFFLGIVEKCLMFCLLDSMVLVIPRLLLDASSKVQRSIGNVSPSTKGNNDHGCLLENIFITTAILHDKTWDFINMVSILEKFGKLQFEVNRLEDKSNLVEKGKRYRQDENMINRRLGRELGGYKYIPNMLHEFTKWNSGSILYDTGESSLLEPDDYGIQFSPFYYCDSLIIKE